MPNNIQYFGVIESKITSDSTSRKSDHIKNTIKDGNVLSLVFTTWYSEGNADNSLTGHLKEDILHIDSANIYGEGSNTAYNEQILPWFETTKGIFEAIVVYDNMEIYHLFVKDGVVSEKEIDLVELWKNYRELQKIIGIRTIQDIL